LFIIVNNEDSVFLKFVDSYKMEAQQENGYFVGLIGMSYLRDFFTARGAKLEILGSNFLHSYFRHTCELLSRIDDAAAISEELMMLALPVDLDSAHQTTLSRALADQFLVKILK
jgi:hypothetical protein